MRDNEFFRPTALYKEYQILEMVATDPKLTQRSISDRLGISVSMVNGYLDDFEANGLIVREHLSSKTVSYRITHKGSARQKVLNIGFLKSAHQVYDSAKDNIKNFLMQIAEKGFRDILLYGAGEVAEIMLRVIEEWVESPVKVKAIIDDDIEKQGTPLLDVPVIPFPDRTKYPHDGILASSYTNHDIIFNKLISMEYDKTKIIQFF